MNVLVIGAGGMLGRKLTAALTKSGHIGGRPLTALTLADIVPVAPPDSPGPVNTVVADISQPGVAKQLLASRPDLVFHLAAIVSAEAETEFDKGYSINLDATRSLFETIRHMSRAYRPRLVYTSSVAVFGPMPEVIDDTHQPTPLTSYGTQKAMCELLLADYTRKGFLDGIAIRLPTIVIRPGRPNNAASSFFSSILREPLIGREAVLPVSEAVRHWFASPRAAVDFLLHAAQLDTRLLGSVCALTMPGFSATVADALEALRRVAGDRTMDLVRHVADPAVSAIIDRWPRSFNTCRAKKLGFRAEASFDEVIRIHIEDELGGRLPSRARAS